MTVEIEYWFPGGHLDRVTNAQRASPDRLARRVDGLRPTTGHDGVFTIRVDDEQICDRSQAFDLDRIIADMQT